MKIIDIIDYSNPGQRSLDDPGGAFRIKRLAVRAVAVDADGRVQMVSVQRPERYFKLPGGGVDPGEELERALHREMLEETGLEIEVRERLGLVVQYDRDEGFRQDSICFLARVTGGTGNPGFTEKETGDGFAPVVFDSLSGAIAAVAALRPQERHVQSMTRRELAVLTLAKQEIRS